mgnify:CR=1 FL=1
MFSFRRKKNTISFSLHKRLEEYHQAPKKSFSLVFKRPITSARNLPKKYANALFGRPHRKVHISYSKFLIFSLLLLVVVYFALFSRFFKVKTITVVNNRVLLESDIANFLYERNVRNKNIFLVNSEQMKDALKDYYKRIDEVRVYKVLPSKLKIKIKEKPSTIVWVTKEQKYLLDDNGYVLGIQQEAVDMPKVVDLAGLPVKESDRIVTRAFIDFVNTADESLKKRFGMKVAGFSINQTTFELRADTYTGKMVKSNGQDKDGKELPETPEMGPYFLFDTLHDPAEQLDKLTRLLANGEKIKEYVILSIEGRVIVK